VTLSESGSTSAAPAVDASRHGYRVALVHDYLTVRGGAERVVLAMARAFPAAPLYTSLYNPEGTFPEFEGIDVRVTPLNRFGVLRRDHRKALPFLSRTFRRLDIDADIVLCSSSGWAHQVSTRGSKVVYCHNPARWLYQTDQYMQTASLLRRAALGALAGGLRRRDRRAARGAVRYVVNSSTVLGRVADVYGLSADLLHPPPAMTPDGSLEPISGIDPGFFLVVSRLMAYKNVDVVIDAFAALPEKRLVIVGTGPERDRLVPRAGGNVSFLGGLADSELRWLYANCVGLVSASHEDFGLTPLEAASFGKPSIVLRCGGFLDTVVAGRTGLFFEKPRAVDVADAIERMLIVVWDASAIREHANRFAEERFISRLQQLVLTAAVSPPAGGAS
jgi:glycosyltransferase involved in cell wall biosynthesis